MHETDALQVRTSYVDFLDYGRTPLKTEGRCPFHGTVMDATGTLGQASPSGAARRGASLMSPAPMTLEQAYTNNLIDLYELPAQALALLDSPKPVTIGGQATNFAFTITDVSGSQGAVAVLVTSGRVSTTLRGTAVVVDPGILVRCPTGATACRSDESATAVMPRSSARVRRSRRVVVGRAHFVTPAGGSQELAFKLQAAGVQLLHKLRRLRLTVTATTRLGANKAVGTTKVVTITPPRPKRRKGRPRGIAIDTRLVVMNADALRSLSL